MLDSAAPRQKNDRPVIPRPRFRFRVGLGIFMLLLLAAGIFIGSRLVIFAQRIFESEGGIFSFKQLFLADDKELQGEADGQVHILLLGIGGEGHEGATLTDTMILATLKFPQNDGEKPQLALLSVPRDLVVYLPEGYQWLKINSAYAYGDLGDRSDGPEWAVNAVEELAGVSIPYYGLVDFAGFEKIVDDLGGVEINVERAFTDSLYPDEKLGYLPPLSFEQGPQKMDGVKALQYVRSRHGSNSEGSDFARARRQQLFLKAVKDKATSFRVLTNLNLIDQLLDDLTNHVRTNLEPFELRRVYDLTKNLESNQIHSLTLDYQSGTICDEITEEGAYILLPCAGLGNYTGIRELVRNQFTHAALQSEQPTVEVQNASRTPLLAQRTEAYLRTSFLTTGSGNFRGETVYTQSVIYDNTGGKKPQSLEYLKQKLGVLVAQSPYPFPTTLEKPDFVIVVTSDLQEKIP
ncbi:MAG: hypothetical protein A3K06_01695 [Candidatus Doudnabacteria bacterium RIFCSPHIGHO2_01_52_17]|uniref:Cell envelope-related transcriptional attenuator domain-containing protein n=1 Tax=Candidatus Doudnabacteria bacterium RIFCSPHIGHO2_01_52_17 TaxID=1817820 RepID=A0A1F5NEJ6_9BACT|nr:MAG: hypothetical protein A3K06_01695 [Candidatus Doudnabacteria bacterium RIFCSPHIGHO2_01_52_17]